ncbi:MAG: hypothetical protein MZU91_00210 [Desulfosudis oleivorans]|nr:hypothetical protein [Desulfosudis oleivorans]
MLKDFLEVGKTLGNRFVRQWKEEGRQVVGFTCSYVPEEIIHAGGMLPFRSGGSVPRPPP